MRIANTVSGVRQGAWGSWPHHTESKCDLVVRLNHDRGLNSGAEDAKMGFGVHSVITECPWDLSCAGLGVGMERRRGGRKGRVGLGEGRRGRREEEGEEEV